MYRESFLFYKFHRINAAKFRRSFPLRRIHEKSDDNISPTLPVLEATIKLIQDAGGFSKKFKENILINIIFKALELTYFY